MNLLQQPPHWFKQQPLRVAVVTGLSNPNSCELTQAQRELITLPELPAEAITGRNFPFVAETEDQPQQPSLMKASLSNGLHFLRTFSAEYQRKATPHWTAILDSTDRLLVITGSCGLQLMNTSDYIRQHSAKIEVLAFGPVASKHPSFPATLLQGSRDYLSRLCFRKPEITIPDVGHMDYWTHPKVREVAIQWLRDRISR